MPILSNISSHHLNCSQMFSDVLAADVLKQFPWITLLYAYSSSISFSSSLIITKFFSSDNGFYFFYKQFGIFLLFFFCLKFSIGILLSFNVFTAGFTVEILPAIDTIHHLRLDQTSRSISAWRDSSKVPVLNHAKDNRLPTFSTWSNSFWKEQVF